MFLQKERKQPYLIDIQPLPFLVMYPDPGSNRDGLLHWCLRPARLPIPPSGRGVYVKTGAKIHIFSKSHKFLKENHAVKD